MPDCPLDQTITGDIYQVIVLPQDSLVISSKLHGIINTLHEINYDSTIVQSLGEDLMELVEMAEVPLLGYRHVD